MPLIRIDIVKGKSPEYKKTLLDCVHEGLVEALGIADWDRFQRIVEIDREGFEFPEGKTDAFMIIEITMFPGRTTEQKKAVIERVTARITERLGIPATDVFIVLNEPADENWGFAGRQRGKG